MNKKRCKVSLHSVSWPYTSRITFLTILEFSQVVLFYLLIERRTADAQQFRRFALVPSCPFQSRQDALTLLPTVLQRQGIVLVLQGNVQFQVSVSAMPPCTQSFIPLPLPHEYNLNDMIASKRYESVWNTFLKELTRDSAVTLSSLQKKWHVNRSGMKQWMRDNGLSVKEAKKHIHECRHYAEEGQMLPLPATAGNLFLPMTTDQPALQPESCDILSGVSLVFPDGTQVNIRRGSAQAVMSFLKLYQREDLPCLD